MLQGWTSEESIHSSIASIAVVLQQIVAEISSSSEKAENQDPDQSIHKVRTETLAGAPRSAAIVIVFPENVAALSVIVFIVEVRLVGHDRSSLCRLSLPDDDDRSR